MSCSSYTSTAARRWTLSLLEWQAHTDYSSWIWLAQNSHAAEHILLWAKHAWYLLASQQPKTAWQVNSFADVCCWCMSAGAVATASALIHDAKSFYILRLLLGVFESGAAPAMWYAVSQFYPSERCVKLLLTLAMTAQSTVYACGAQHLRCYAALECMGTEGSYMWALAGS